MPVANRTARVKLDCEVRKFNVFNRLASDPLAPKSRSLSGMLQKVPPLESGPNLLQCMSPLVADSVEKVFFG
jgi:hypothetical protein